MASARVSVLTRKDILATANSFAWNRQLPKWTVIVEGKELPARPLVLCAAGVPPNDSTNSHQAVAILAEQGFDVRYQGKAVGKQKLEDRKLKDQAALDLIDELCGSVKDAGSLLAAREREHRIEKDRWPR